MSHFCDLVHRMVSIVRGTEADSWGWHGMNDMRSVLCTTAGYKLGAAQECCVHPFCVVHMQRKICVAKHQMWYWAPALRAASTWVGVCMCM